MQSGLITGTQWDTMCNFIGWTTCNSDCTDWGNHYNIKSKVYTEGEVWHSGTQEDSQLYYWYNTAVTKTASNTADARMIFATGNFVNENNGTTDKKNIYDVAGNAWEWTTETINRDDTIRVLRGGSVNNNGDEYLATTRHGYASTTGFAWSFGFRTVLYVKYN